MTTSTADDGHDGGAVGLSDMLAECVEALVGFLKAIEPALEGFDFTTATAADMEALSTDMEPLADEYATTVEDLDCPEVETRSDTESFAEMIAIAEREAPGTVGYLEWIQGLAATPDSFEASGDCETGIAAFEGIVDEVDGRSDHGGGCQGRLADRLRLHRMHSGSGRGVLLPGQGERLP